MRNRTAALILSIVIAAMVYYALYRLAPRILIFEPDTTAAALVKRYKVDIVPDVSESATSAYIQDASGLGSRPGSVRDLMTRDVTETAEVDIPDPDTDVVDNASERLASDTISRDHDLDQSEDRLKRMEARVLEIERDTVRQDVQVARRLVRPSSDNILPEGAEPVLRGPTTDAPRPVEIAIPAPNLFEGITPREEEARAGAPPAEPSSRPPLEAPTTLPTRALETMDARAPAMREQQEAREESDYTFLDDLVDVELAAWRGRPGEPGFFRVRILPKGEGAFKPLPKLVHYVIDASSSIHPRKLTLGARGVMDSLDQLREGDLFNVVIFRDSPRFFLQTPGPPTKENIAGARAFLSDLEARGETDVFNALQPVVRTPIPEGMAGIVILLSDGRPTTGLQDGRTIINGLTADNAYDYGIYAFGGGNTVNRPLLDMLAYRNAGTVQVSEDMNDMQGDFPPFSRQFEAPLLTGCRAAYAGSGVEEVYPRRLSDFFRGRAVTLYGRFDTQNADSFVMRLTGNTAAGPHEVVFRARFDEAEAGTQALARDWAMEKAYAIVGEISLKGEDPARMAELRVLRERYDVRTPYHP
jgi:hypothetical protein